MKQDKNWFYYNDLPETIPIDITKLSNKEITDFLEKWNNAVWTKSTQIPQNKLKNIKDLPAIKTTIPEWIMDRLKETTNHYVNGEWLSTIALSATISEYITYNLLEKHISEKGIDIIISHNKKLGNQNDRLLLLKKLEILSSTEYTYLDKIRINRNNYLHLNKIDFTGAEIKKDALESIKNLITYLNENES